MHLTTEVKKILKMADSKIRKIYTNLKSKRSSKKSQYRIKEINRSIKEVKNTLNEMKKLSKK